MSEVQQVLAVLRELTYKDAKKHLEHPFQVSEGTTQLNIIFEFEPEQIEGYEGSNNLSLTLFDPQGVRGAGHNCRNKTDLQINATSASPGYVPGVLQPGIWMLVIDTHMVLPAAPLQYRLEASVSFDLVPEEATKWVKGKTNPRGTGWYRGDLHAHTIHSDARWDVPDLVNEARKVRLDFVTLTDHNTVSPLMQMDSLATDDLLTMGGVELTTFYGHALALGLRQWIDWRVCEGKRTMQDIAAEVEAAGGLFVIAHPMSPGDPICTGCDWQYADMMPGTARIVEVWNDGRWESYDEDGLALWYSWLNQGYRMVATAGTDVHDQPPADIPAGFNFVYAEELSEKAILQAVRLGHLYLSSGPKLVFTATDTNGGSAMMGDALKGEIAQITIRWEGAPEENCLRLIANGEVYAEYIVDATGEQTWQVSPDQANWYVAELRDKDGVMLAVTNPIFVQVD